MKRRETLAVRGREHTTGATTFRAARDGRGSQCRLGLMLWSFGLPCMLSCPCGTALTPRRSKEYYRESSQIVEISRNRPLPTSEEPDSVKLNAWRRRPQKPRKIAACPSQILWQHRLWLFMLPLCLISVRA